MDITLTNETLEPEPSNLSRLTFNQESLLNSNFKRTADQNFNGIFNPSVFSLRQRVKLNQYQRSIPLGVALKLSVFLIAIAMIF